MVLLLDERTKFHENSLFHVILEKIDFKVVIKYLVFLPVKVFIVSKRIHQILTEKIPPLSPATPKLRLYRNLLATFFIPLPKLCVCIHTYIHTYIHT